MPRGRPKGSTNRYTTDFKYLVLKSLKNRGGIRWINALEDDQFIQLLKAVTPKPLEISGPDSGPLVIEVKDA